MKVAQRMEHRRRKRNDRPPFSVLAIVLAGISFIALTRHTARQDYLDQTLIAAIRSGNVTLARAALAEGANPNSHAAKETSSSFWRHFMTQFLHRPSHTGPLALTLAVQANNASLVGDLISAGAKDQKEKLQAENGVFKEVPCTLVMYAAWKGNASIIRKLIENGSDINTTDSENRTALLFATNGSSIQVLVDCGAKVNVTDKYGFTALDLSIRSHHYSVRSALINRGARDRKALSFAIEFDDIQGLRQMLDAGADIEQPDEDGLTPLMNALFSPLHLSSEAALLLIRHGANVNFDKDGTTPLFFASDGGRYPEMDEASPAILRALIASGANLNARNKEGYTPLMVASDHLRPKLAQILLRHGAKVNIKSKQGDTALSLARTSSYRETHRGDAPIVVRLLKQAGETE